VLVIEVIERAGTRWIAKGKKKDGGPRGQMDAQEETPLSNVDITRSE